MGSRVSFDLNRTDMIDLMERGVCHGCGRKMYKTEPEWGTPSEWRHDSSAHAISWIPERHIAGITTIYEHQHKWTVPDVHRTKRCEVYGCDSEVIETKPLPADPPLTERERRQQVSRLRGSSARGNRPPRGVPEVNPSK